MKKHITSLIILFVSLVLTSLPVTAALRDLESAKVSVYPHILNGKSAYTYVVESAGNESIATIRIGHEYYTGSTELSGSHPLEVISPEGWSHLIINLEESDKYEVMWTTDNSTEEIQPNQSKTGFTIVMDSETPEMIYSSWSVVLSGGAPVQVSEKLIVLDNAPDDLIK